jgi:aspartyl-tRNA(Asn)/glutamyl-tRNA(Gln) amidotransferase subunit C
MPIDRDLITHLEELARIELAGDERELLTRQLARIVDFVKTIQAVDTTGVEETSSPIHLDESHLRDDDPRRGLDREEALREAPDEVDGYYRVPPVIECDEAE